MNDAFIPAVRSGLAGAGDPDRARHQQAYMKSTMPYRGLGLEVLEQERPVLDVLGGHRAVRDVLAGDL